MSVVETDKPLYLLYQAPSLSNADYLDHFKAHLKVSDTHNGDVVYHTGLTAEAPPEKHNITGDDASEEQNIKANIKARDI